MEMNRTFTKGVSTAETDGKLTPGATHHRRTAQSPSTRSQEEELRNLAPGQARGGGNCRSPVRCMGPSLITAPGRGQPHFAPWTPRGLPPCHGPPSRTAATDHRRGPPHRARQRSDTIRKHRSRIPGRLL